MCNRISLVKYNHYHNPFLITYTSHCIFQEPKKSSELNLYLGVSATSTSPGKKHAQPKVSPTTLFSPDMSSCKKTSFEAHPNPANKIKNLPPLPNAKTST